MHKSAVSVFVSPARIRVGALIWVGFGGVGVGLGRRLWPLGSVLRSEEGLGRFAVNEALVGREHHVLVPQEPEALLALVEAEHGLERVDAQLGLTRADVRLQRLRPHPVDEEVDDVSRHLGRLGVEAEERLEILPYHCLAHRHRKLHVCVLSLSRGELPYRRGGLLQHIRLSSHCMQYPIGNELVGIGAPTRLGHLRLVIELCEGGEAARELGKVPLLQRYARVRFVSVAGQASFNALQPTVLLDAHQLLLRMRIVGLVQPLRLHQAERLAEHRRGADGGGVRCEVQPQVAAFQRRRRPHDSHPRTRPAQP
eukprot:CAMPEP_0181300372 /NCGR_PEP_ID=MMETSP1101-20121128/6854_1 /TAXON_ID=46948 /ORGANISM="Rhodomonas abbreviata, Strain Caron Lab Isolate" /LENGTH=310 /DNA_ID=CAMNT_0023405603 /DNA_START=349 /DNA_END=1281 /DNA_ORIENTATION=+